MSYQYTVEVVNVIPADALGGGTQSSKITLRCVRRDATFDCMTVPAVFEVRNAPGYDLLECVLASHDDSHTILAHSVSPLVMGGPHRTVGAVWVPLEPVASSLSLNDTQAPSLPTARIFVAWTMSKMDGSPLCQSELEAPPSASRGGSGGKETGRGESATPCASVETSPPLGIADATLVGRDNVQSPVAMLAPSLRTPASAGCQGEDTQPAGQNAKKPDSPSVGTHVSIVLDEAQEAAVQQRDEERANGLRRVSSESATTSTLRIAVDRNGGCCSAEEVSQRAQRLILSQFPSCNVSSSLVEVSEMEAVEAAAEGKASTTERSAGADEKWFSARPAVMDYYAASTHNIGPVPYEKRYRNLLLAPCPLLLDHLQAEAQPASSTAATSAGMTSNELWGVSHRHGVAGAHLGSATSAVETIRREREARQRTKDAAAADVVVATSNKGDAVEGDVARAAEVGEMSTLALLRQQAMAAMRRRRVTYST
jgi:hypothetical protein